MLYFKVLFVSYKKELLEFLSNDPHLQRVFLFFPAYDVGIGV